MTSQGSPRQNDFPVILIEEDPNVHFPSITSAAGGDLLSPSTPALKSLSAENSRLFSLKKKQPNRQQSLVGHSLEGESLLQEQTVIE